MKATIAFALYVAVSASAAMAQDGEGPFSCRNQMLRGDYALEISGTRPAPAPPGGTPSYVPGTPEALIGVGVRTFDGEGTFTQVTNEKGSLSGILFPNRSLHGTYSVNPDCSGSLSLFVPGLPVPIVYDLVLSADGRKFNSIVATPQPVMVVTTGVRMH